MTRKEIAKQILLKGDPNEIITALIWTATDVMWIYQQLYCKDLHEMEKILAHYDSNYRDRDEFCAAVLDAAQSEHDADWGVSWETFKIIIPECINDYKLTNI